MARRRTGLSRPVIRCQGGAGPPSLLSPPRAIINCHYNNNTSSASKTKKRQNSLSSQREKSPRSNAIRSGRLLMTIHPATSRAEEEGGWKRPRSSTGSRARTFIQTHTHIHTSEQLGYLLARLFSWGKRRKRSRNSSANTEEIDRAKHSPSPSPSPSEQSSRLSFHSSPAWLPSHIQVDDANAKP